MSKVVPDRYVVKPLGTGSNVRYQVIDTFTDKAVDQGRAHNHKSNANHRAKGLNAKHRDDVYQAQRKKNK